MIQLRANLDNHEFKIKKSKFYFTQYLHIIQFESIKTYWISYKPQRKARYPSCHAQLDFYII